MILYNEKDLNTLLKKTKNSFIFIWIFLGLFVTSATCFILLSTYELRILFEVLGSIISTLFVLLVIFFIFKNKYFYRLANEYSTILFDNGIKQTFVVESFKKEKTTLMDNSTVYEINIITNEKIKTIYLSSLFEPAFIAGKKYEFVLVQNYIKEYYEKN